jgi:hypothetical protein
MHVSCTDLFGSDDHDNRPGQHDRPEKQARWKRARTIRRDDDVVEEKCEGKVENVGRFADEVVKGDDAGKCETNFVRWSAPNLFCGYVDLLNHTCYEPCSC